ncbi:MAG: hypothetical protein EA390_03335 [Balneolaceae bacterium]|nr:MAG: hypothetical protein EA390_03335 [Balneolaceae bacterium]
MVKIPTEQTVWKIAAIGFGLIVSIAIIFIMQFINHSLYTAIDGVSIENKEQYSAFIHNNPLYLLGVLISNAAGSFTGGAVAKLIRNDITAPQACIVGLVLMILAFVNIVAVSHPVWFWILSVFAFIPFSWYGALFIQKQINKIT